MTIGYSAIIPTRNRLEDLVIAVETLLAQRQPPTEIVIVDQSDSDASSMAIHDLFERREPLTALIYELDPRVDGAAEARNVGLRLSRESLILCLDDDAAPEAAATAMLIRSLQDNPELVAVSGIISNYTPPTAISRTLQRIFYRGPFWDERQPVYWDWAKYGCGQLIPTNKVTGSFTMFRRETLLAIGGFDRRYRGAAVGEDIEISQRLARRGRLAFVGGALLTHASRGAWKHDGARALGRELVAAHYLLSRNPQPSLTAPVCFGWMSLWILANAILGSLRRASLAPLRSLLSAVRTIHCGYSGCSFLKPADGREGHS